MNAQKQPGYSVKETNDSITFSIRSKKSWLQYLLSIFWLLALIGVILFYILCLINIILHGITLRGLPVFVLNFLFFALIPFAFYLGFRRTLDYSLPQETIEVSGTSIKIEKSGFLMFRKKKVIPAEKIKGISLNIQLSAPENKLGDLFMNTLKTGKLFINTQLRMTPFYSTCRNISEEEVIRIIDSILNKFPQYKYM